MIGQFKSANQNIFMSKIEDVKSEVLTDTSKNGLGDQNDPGNLLKILVATDNHLGFMEKDPIRKDDSFIAFEEILSLAKEKQVDFLLLGGDLFNDNKPSRDTLHKTIELFRKYTLGDNPVKFQVISEQKTNFKNAFGSVNFEDPNFNVGLPVFAIHGNHDDPTGENGLSALDLLSTSNFLNYFGKTENIDEIHVKPILIQKGQTKLALYGLGNIRDERLYRTFQNKKVKFYREKENPQQWFNLFVLHQNRNQHHTAKSSISESMLRGFFDLVIWGHEHEQRIKPQRSAEGNFDIMQPGSSIITDLNPEEVIPKKIALLEICKDKYRVSPIQLQTNRVFVYDTISLDEDLEINKTSSEAIINHLAVKMEEMLKSASKTLAPKQILEKWPTLTLPLFRLRVEYTSGYATINPQRFGQRFVDKCANPASILLLTRKRPKKERVVHKSEDGKEEEEEDDPETVSRTGVSKIDDFIVEFLATEKNKLSVLNVKGLHESVSQFVEKEEKDAIDVYVSKFSEQTCIKLYKDMKTNEQDEMDIFLAKYQLESQESVVNDSLNLPSFIEKPEKTDKKKTKKKKVDSDDEEEESPKKTKKKKTTKKKKDASDEDEEDAEPVEKPKRGRGSRGGRGGSTRGAARGGKKIKIKPISSEEDEIEQVSEEDTAAKTRKRKVTPVAKATPVKKESIPIDLDIESDDEKPAKKKKVEDQILEISSDQEVVTPKKTFAGLKKK